MLLRLLPLPPFSTTRHSRLLVATVARMTSSTTTVAAATTASLPPPPSLPTESARALANDACRFLTASTDPYHAVKQSVLLLQAAGFVALPNNAMEWSSAASTDAAGVVPKIQPGGKYYYTVQNSTLVAFAVGDQFGSTRGDGTGIGAFHIIGGHTDSPNLRIKPRSKKNTSAVSKTTQLAVECYGGGLWHTWFDRDLSLSGKVLVRTTANDTNATTTKIEQRLVQWSDPVARVSTLCIHLQSASEREAFAVNKEDHTSPIIGSTNANSNNSSMENGNTNIQTTKNAVQKELEESVANQIQSGGDDSWLQHQEPTLLTRLALDLNVSASQIVDFDLSLYDTQPAAVGGMHGEFLYSARLDNLATVFTAVTALTRCNLEASSDIAMVVCFDHEEVGSVSANGAGSPVLLQAVQQVSAALSNKNNKTSATSIARSFCLSIDQAHAIHPNYASKHDSMHAPVMNGGVVIKTNSNQRYTTNSLTGFVVRELGRKANVPIQEFCGA